MKEFNGSMEDFMSFLNGGKTSHDSDGLEFLIECGQKIEKLSNTNYAKANPYIEAYLNAINYIKNIYENPTLDNIKENYGNLKNLIEQYENINLKNAAKKVIAYADNFKDEAKMLKEELFWPAASNISHSFDSEADRLLKGALYHSIFDQVNQLFDIGTFGCVLNDALNAFPSRQIDVIEELSRFKGRLDFIKGEIICAQANEYCVDYAFIEDELEE